VKARAARAPAVQRATLRLLPKSRNDRGKRSHIGFEAPKRRAIGHLAAIASEGAFA
jgi:hypothetical protein